MKTLSIRWTLLLMAVVCLGGGCTKAQKKERAFKKAERYFQAGEYDQAMIEYQKAQSYATSLDPVIFGRAGTIYQEQGRSRPAKAYLEKSLALKDDPGFLLKWGEACLPISKSNSFWSAIQILNKDPENGDAQTLLVQATDGTTNLTRALTTLQQLPQQMGGGAKYHIALGMAFLRQRDLKQADAEIQHALELDPKSGQAYLMQANIRLMQTNIAAAEAALKKAWEFAPPRSPISTTYAQFMLGTRRVDEARKLLLEVTKKTPDYLPAWLLLAQIGIAQKTSGGRQEAEAALNRILAREPDNADALMLSGDLAMDTKNPGRASAQYEKIFNFYSGLKTNPQIAPILYYKMALARKYAMDDSSAVEFLQKALTLDTNHVDAALMMADYDINAGNPALAVESIKRMVPYLWDSMRASTNPEKGRADLQRLQQTHLTLAIAYISLGQPEMAIKQYQSMLQHFAGNAPVVEDVQIRMGRLYLDMKQFKAARDACEAALVVAPNSVRGLEALTDVDMAEGKFAEALERIQKEVTKRPNLGKLYLIQGRIHWFHALSLLKVAQFNAKNPDLEVGDVPEAGPDVDAAEKSLRRAIQLEPDLHAAYHTLGVLYNGAHKQKEALDRLQSFVQKTNDLTALMLIGIIQEKSQDYAGARDAYEKLLKSSTDAQANVAGVRMVAMNNLANIYSDRFHQLDKAYEMASRAVELHPNEPIPEDTLGWILYQRKEFDRALPLLEESVSKLKGDGGRDNLEIQLHLGLTYYMLGREAAAIRLLEKVQRSPEKSSYKAQAEQKLAILKIDPTTADAKAIAQLEQFQKGDPDDPVVVARLAEIQARDGLFEKAASTYEKCLKLSPRNVEILYRTSLLYLDRLNDPGKALTLARTAHDLAPNNARVSHLLGRLVFQKRDFTWASSLLEESARTLPRDPAVAYDLAWSQYSMGRDKEALTSMKLASGLTNRMTEASRFLSFVQAAQNAKISDALKNEVQAVVATNASYVPGLMLLALNPPLQNANKEAVQLYERILSIYPNFVPATRNLAALYFAQENYRKAYELASKAMESLPNDKELLKILGIVACRNGDWDRAQLLLRDCLSTRGPDAELWFYLGKAQYKSHDRSGSKQSLDKALAMNLKTLKPDLWKEATDLLKELK